MSSAATRDDAIQEARTRLDGFRTLQDNSTTEWGRRHYAREIEMCEQKLRDAQMLLDEDQAQEVPRTIAS